MNVRCISRSKYLLTRKQGNESRGEGTWVYLIMCKILRYLLPNQCSKDRGHDVDDSRQIGRLTFIFFNESRFMFFSFNLL